MDTIEELVRSAPGVSDLFNESSERLDKRYYG